MSSGIKKLLFLFPFTTDARDVEQLSKNNITHILSIHDSARPMLEKLTFQEKKEQSLEYSC
uniref:Uncharacterized protein n=1 Tax=Nothoprocta perdicaria TaxID=30464 RepID=A0A8C6ZFC8_NOTPE